MVVCFCCCWCWNSSLTYLISSCFIHSLWAALVPGYWEQISLLLSKLRNRESRLHFELVSIARLISNSRLKGIMELRLSDSFDPSPSNPVLYLPFAINWIFHKLTFRCMHILCTGPGWKRSSFSQALFFVRWNKTRSQPADGAPLGPKSVTRYDYSTQLEVVESPIANRNLLILSFHNRFVTHQRNLSKRDAKCVVASLSSRCVVVSFKVSNEASLWTTLT